MNIDERFPDIGVVRDAENGGNGYYDDYDYATLEDIMHEMVEAQEMVGVAMSAVQDANTYYRMAMEQEGVYNATLHGEEELNDSYEQISIAIDNVRQRMEVAEYESNW